MRLLSASEGTMICKECADTAARNAEVMALIEKDELVEGDVLLEKHPENCGCPCMHMKPGSWKGKK